MQETPSPLKHGEATPSGPQAQEVIPFEVNTTLEPKDEQTPSDMQAAVPAVATG